MTTSWKGRIAGAGLAVLAHAGQAQAGVIAPELALQIAQHGASDRLPVIVQLADRVNLEAYAVSDRRLRNNALHRALKDKSARGLARLLPQLEHGGASHQAPLWLINGVAVTLPVWALEELARSPLVGRIQYDAVVTFAAIPAASAAPAPSWNVAAVHAPQLWSIGASGAGVVVANMDTGVDKDHPDLGPHWRGGSNSWFDPYQQHPAPYDSNGHGTQTMGLMAAGSASGNALGMAPDARWIAAKVFDDAGNATLSKLHLAFQWLLDPDGNPATLDAPDVVNASWGLAGVAPGACNLEFDEDIRALTSAGILIVFAAGNDGPDPGSGASPAANPSAWSAGSVDQNLAIDSLSSRGPSGCDATVFPKLVAPGVNVLSTDLSFGGLPLYATVSGTSFAAPHVAGAMALLAAAFPTASVAAIRAALTDSAHDLGAAGADNSYGYGLLDVQAAAALLAATPAGAHAPVITSTAPAGATAGQPYNYQLTATDADGGALAYALASGPAGMAINAATGLLSWTPSTAQLGSNVASVSVTDPGGLGASQTFTVTVQKPNSAPLASADSYSVAAGATLTVAAPGVLANDKDADGDPISAQLAANAAHGSVALAANGAFSYVPAAGYAGTDSFTYRASDGKTSGNTATVSLTVLAALKPPLAVNDSFSAPVYRSAPYAARVLNVLANDSAPGSQLSPATLAIVSPPSKGGSAQANSNGTLAYIPKLRFSGTETLTYRVRNAAGVWSNTATVTVRVQ